MKILAAFMFVLLIGANYVEAQGPKKPKAKSMKPVMAYEADYSAKFSIADDTYSSIVLGLWKDFEENNFERNVKYFAEDITAEFSDGEIVSGRDNLVNGAKAYRATLTDFSTKILSYISLRSDDKDENWVAVWGEDSFTDEKGNKVIHNLHELMRFNKEGKIDYMRQYIIDPKQ